MKPNIDPVILMSVDHITRSIFPDILDRLGLAEEASSLRSISKIKDDASMRQSFISVRRLRLRRVTESKLDKVVDDILYWIGATILCIRDEELSKQCFKFLERSLTEVFSVGPITPH